MTTSRSLNKRKRMMAWTGIITFLAILLLPMAGYISTGFATTEKPAQQTNPRADFWRLVRGNTAGYSAVTGRESNVLIQGSGQNWRQIRNGPVAKYGSWLLSGMLAILALFYICHGKVAMTHPRTGQTVERWTVKDRWLHWITTGLFIVLSITGLSLLYGRAVLIPIFGHDGFSAYADIAKLAHNILGPAFMFGLLLMIVNWFNQNLLNRIDWQWFKAFGGMIGDKHPSAEKLNGGEKMWFWSLATAGVALCISGLILDFPNFDQQRQLLQLSHLIHVITALVLIAFAFGHAYIGTIGTEGALEGMVTGQVDTAWAEQHHDLWLEEVQQQEQSAESD